MKSKLALLAKIVGTVFTLAVVTFLGYSLGERQVFRQYSKSPDATVRAPEYAPDQPPGGICKLVAVAPDGTKVYRIEGTDMIVPAVLAVSPNGQVAFR